MASTTSFASSSSKSKRKRQQEVPNSINEELDLFVDHPVDESSDSESDEDDSIGRDATTEPQGGPKEDGSDKDDDEGDLSDDEDDDDVSSNDESGYSEFSGEDAIGEIVTLEPEPWRKENDNSNEKSAGDLKTTTTSKSKEGDALKSETTKSKLLSTAQSRRKVKQQLRERVENAKNALLSEEKTDEVISDQLQKKANDSQSAPDAQLEGVAKDALAKDAVVDEYEFDSSDEEDIRNTVGNIPMEWYQGFEHIGYNVKGEKIVKPPTRDELDEFLNKVDNPDYWRTVFDKKNGEDIVLSQEDIDVIQRIQKGHYPESSVDPYAPYIDFFTHEEMIHPVTRRPDHKRSFIPSLTEKERVSRYVVAMKECGMKPIGKPKPLTDEDLIPKFYDIWSKDDNDQFGKRHGAHIVAPKMRQPGHMESYNPPPEYLLNEDEKLALLAKEDYDGKKRFIPERFECLRKVPLYNRFFQERFDRCLDLYLCPRQRRLRVQVEAEDLLPQLPKPKDLQPFPTTLSLLYLGHTSYVRSISADPSGQWLVSGSDDKTVRFWEVSTGRCLQTIEVDETVQSVAWCPNPSLSLVAFSVGHKVHIFNPQLGDKLVTSDTDKLIEDYQPPEELKTSPLVEWEVEEGAKFKQGFRLHLKHFKPVKQITWHGKGDYFSTVVPEGHNSSVLIHQLSKRRSQAPFKKSKGLVQCTSFHPTRPFFFVATQRHVRIYNLLKQELSKKLLTSAKWVSSISIHPGGDNLIIGTYDCKLSWFDLDLSVKPYHTLRHHREAIRDVCYHKRYPLFASASDDGTVVVCHGQVYNDLLQNPLIVPVKVLKGHPITNGLGVLCCEFHPSQPWLFSSAADGVIRLFT